MKKAGTIKKIRNFFLIVLTACFFCFESCGLESFYYLEEPLSDGHTPLYTASDPLMDYFSFLTNESGDNNMYVSGSEFVFQGTEVYYLIYNNYSEMINRENSIDSLNSSTNYSSAAEKLISTYKYQVLNLEYGDYTGTLQPLIKANGNDRYVYIRLNDYGSEISYQSGICIGSDSMSVYDPVKSLTVNGNIVKPRRTDGSSTVHGFNFNPDDDATDENPVPSADDADVYVSSNASEEGCWYVDMYAVSVGRDNNYSTSYSKVLFLGSIKINSEDYKD